ncbi:MAG TPA: signal peptidase II [Myxococcota bacterium]|jgi:signal peptidase II
MTRILALLACLLPCIACDQATKILAVSHLKGGPAVNVVDGMFRLTYAENPGAFLSLGAHLPDAWRIGIFTVGVALLLTVVAVMLARKQVAPLVFAGIALLVAGGVGNLVDRIARPGGRVVDFAQLTAPSPLPVMMRTGVFNVADLQIVGGAALVLVGTMRRRRQPELTA